MKKSESVKVAIRVRPRNQREIDLKSPVCVESEENTIAIKNQKQTKDFTFDHVFPSDTEQRQIYDATAFGLVESVSEGYNGTIFAYGQTGAGKTFTMVGSSADDKLRGIIPRTFSHLMSITQSGEAQQYLMRVSFIQIYNEQIRDLLMDKKKGDKEGYNKKDLKESPDKGVFVKDLLILPVKSIPEMEKLLEIGNKSKTVFATAMNAVSSRSHSIFTVYFETSNEVNGKNIVRAGKLNLVDLAGSERASKTEAVGDRLKEGTKINLSLSALGNVINALAEGKTGAHIPYRDSKLTRLLQDSLGGNTKTMMIASVSPAADNYDETLGTLRYAARAKNIKNAPKINEDPKDAMIREYAEEIRKLKAQLEQRGGQISKELTSLDEDALRKEIQTKIKAEADEQKRRILEEQKQNLVVSEQEKSQLLKKLKQMQEALLKSNETGKFRQTQEIAVKERKSKKRALKKQEELINDKIQQELEENANIIEGDFQKYNSQSEEIAGLKDLVKKLRNKYKASQNEVVDLQQEFQVERELLEESVRVVESHLSFYRNLASMLLTEKEIETIKEKSKYLEETRQYVIPPFQLREDKAHFPKTLTTQQAKDMIEDYKSRRKVQWADITLPEEEKAEERAERLFGKKSMYKIPDYTETTYGGKNYDKIAQKMLDEDPFAEGARGNRFVSTQGQFRRREISASNQSGRHKLAPLTVLPTVKPSSTNEMRPTSRSRDKLAPLPKKQ